MDPTRNPFTPSAGRQPPELAGREAVLERAEITLRRVKSGRHDRSALLIGLRGVGKTVLLNRIYEMAEKEAFQTAYLEAPENKALAEILAPPLRQILLRLDLRKGAADKVQKAIGALRAFASVFEIKIGDIGVGVKTAGTADSGALEADITDLLVAIGEAAREKETAVAIFIDELQYVGSDELAALIAALHRVSQLDLPLLLFGAGLPQLHAIIGDAKSYAERLFHFESISALPEADAANAIKKPIEDEGEKIEPEALRAILQVTKGYPFFLQQWGKHAWNAADGSPIANANVLAATPGAITELDDGFFRVRMERLSPSEKKYLRAMAELGPGPHASGDVAAKLGRKVESVGPIRSKIIAKGVAYTPTYGDIAFTVPMFDEYLRREIPNFAQEAPKKKSAAKKPSPRSAPAKKRKAK
jgi:hypothetical protein